MRTAVTMLMLGALLAVSPPTMAEEDDTPSVAWTHPWLANRLFDYRHRSWGKIKESSIDNLFLKDDLTIRHEPDGSTVRRREFELSLRNPASLPEFLKVMSKSRVTNTQVTTFDVSFIHGGRTTEFSADDLVEYTGYRNSSYIGGGSGLYLPMDRSRSGTLRGIVETRDAPHEGFEAIIAGREFVQTVGSARSRSITVEVPTGTPLQFETRFFRMSELPEPLTEGGYDRTTFSFATLIVPRRQAGAPHVNDSFPSLWWSNQESWEKLAALLDGVWEPKLGTNPEMDAWARELTQGLEGPLDKALAIHNAVAGGWDYLGFYPDESGWTPHSAAQCFRDRIGDCKDKTALMVSLMRVVGLDAHPALVNSGVGFALSTAPSSAFSHAIVRVDDPAHEDGGFFLDSTDGALGSWPVSTSIADRDALVIDDARGRIERIPASPAEHWLEEDETVITLKPDGSVEAELVWRHLGERANQRATKAAASERGEWEADLRRKVLRAWPGAELLSLEDGPDQDAPGHAWSTRARLRTDRLVSRQGPYDIIRLPWLHRRQPTSVRVDARRFYPYVLRPLHQHSRLRLRLPEGAEVVSLPDPSGEDREDWRHALAAQVVGDEAVLELVIQEHPGLMEHSLGEARRNFVREVLALQDQVVVLRRKQP